LAFDSTPAFCSPWIINVQLGLMKKACLINLVNLDEVQVKHG
jgi:hypothetical protein